jgi:hypothetical protein
MFGFVTAVTAGGGDTARRRKAWSGASYMGAGNVAQALLPKTVSDRPSVKPPVSSLVGVPLSKSSVVTITLDMSLDNVHFLPWQSRDSLFRPSPFASDR